MRFILMALFITLPYFSHAQGQDKKFRIKIGLLELLTDAIPDLLDLPLRVDKFLIKIEKEKDEPPLTYTVQVGEEEHSFSTDGEYHEVKFSHDIKGLVVFILDEKRNRAGKPFILKKRR
jgi:hypothetical protein